MCSSIKKLITGRERGGSAYTGGKGFMTSLAYLEKWPMFGGEDGLRARVEWRRQRNGKGDSELDMRLQYWSWVCMCSVVSGLSLVCVYYLLSRVWFFATLWTVVHQAPLSMGFSRQECWSGLPFPPPGDLPQPGIELCLLHWQADSLPLSHLGIPLVSGEAVISTVYFLRGWGRWGGGCARRLLCVERKMWSNEKAQSWAEKDYKIRDGIHVKAITSCIGRQGAGSASALPQWVREEPRQPSGGTNWAPESTGGHAIA